MAGSTAPGVGEAVSELQQALQQVDPVFVLAFHSVQYDAEPLAAALTTAFPGARCVAISTTGEILGDAVRVGSITAFAIGGRARVAVESIPDLRRWRFAEGAALLGRLTDALGLAPTSLHPERHLLLVFADGISGGDELLLGALRELAPSVPLVGASAADDHRFVQTWTSVDGRAHHNSAVVVLLEPALIFRTFAVHHYRARGEKVVVTRSDPERRLVHELDGWDAVARFARLSGIDEDVLRNEPDAAGGSPVQLARRSAEGLRLRAAMSTRGDALVMAGSVEEGAILDVVEAGDIVAATRIGVQEALGSLPGRAQALLLFDCGGRVAFAQRQRVLEATSRAMSQAPAVGMCTYGEYHGARLLNLTLTGVAFSESAATAGGRDGVAD